MRYMLPLLLLTACAQPSGGLDWYDLVGYLESEGLMRTERRPDDAPVTRESLTENFRRIAFNAEEYPLGKDAARQTPAEPFIRKWRSAVRYRLIARPDDLQQLATVVGPFMARLSDITGHPILPAPERPAPDEPANLFILYGPDDLFARLRPARERRGPNDAPGTYSAENAAFVQAWRFARSPCAGKMARSDGADGDPDPKGTIVAAIVLIKREIPLSLLRSCVEEELAQTMGLINDDDDVRPSVFNDDDEFALLTEHDEYLLRILYDDRLEPGMRPEVAMPIVRRIVGELLPES